MLARTVAISCSSKAVWPDVAIKSSPIFQNWSHQCLLNKTYFYNSFLVLSRHFIFFDCYLFPIVYNVRFYELLFLFRFLVKIFSQIFKKFIKKRRKQWFCIEIMSLNPKRQFTIARLYKLVRRREFDQIKILRLFFFQDKLTFQHFDCFNDNTCLKILV